MQVYHSPIFWMLINYSTFQFFCLFSNFTLFLYSTDLLFSLFSLCVSLSRHSSPDDNSSVTEKRLQRRPSRSASAPSWLASMPLSDHALWNCLLVWLFVYFIFFSFLFGRGTASAGEIGTRWRSSMRNHHHEDDNDVIPSESRVIGCCSGYCSQTRRRRRSRVQAQASRIVFSVTGVASIASLRSHDHRRI